MIILADMDGVLADFERGFLENYRMAYPHKPSVPLEERKAFQVKDDYPEELQPLVKAIYQAPGFIRSLPPIAGGLEALCEMASQKHDVFICTSPLSQYDPCVVEKYHWVDEHLGKDWTKKIILANDKTLIHGDILIDDKPEIKGLETPSWEHILYTQPYNRHIDSKRRLTWQDWREVLGV
ncbi:5'-3'-deoxyribonucleotidase [Candidatus Woesearchaeota archaeon]|nr:5'-3'-deoxyribonucleotidase [Candidatus Woesearchaeota archaeon]